jgi:hypothetical protein
LRKVGRLERIAYPGKEFKGKWFPRKDKVVGRLKVRVRVEDSVERQHISAYSFSVPLFVARELIEREGTQPYVMRKGE